MQEFREGRRASHTGEKNLLYHMINGMTIGCNNQTVQGLSLRLSTSFNLKFNRNFVYVLTYTVNGKF